GKVIGHDQGAAGIDGHADGTSARLSVRPSKAGEEVDRRPGGATVAERHEDHLVAGRRASVPTAVLADERAFRELRAHDRTRKREAERGDVRAEAVVRPDGGGDLAGILRAHAVVDVLAPVAVGPAIEA